ncbi:Transmembrane protein -like protein [Oopsacas minuta]|uniref:Transmembrane protein -like protein n=1 Tax=Oopsacas minuta TaxID=111878 RepID=A0AAV7JEU1_9METZ|nr:Transmembrane protein -like protein [Oopsacas minuta]
MNSDTAHRKSLSNHDLIMLDTDTEDEVWKRHKEGYKTLVDDYRNLTKQKLAITTLEAKLKKNCTTLKKDISSYKKPEKQDCIRAIGLFCDETIHKLPSQDNGFLLWIVIGHINVIFDDFDVKMRYKKAYERFKLFSNGVSITLILMTWFLHIPQIILYSMLVYYYFSLTIREHILIKNGSKIKFWWLLHHYLTIIITLLLLTWPPGECYTQSHDVLMFASLMTSVIQLVQFFYQRKTIDRNIMMGKDKFLRTTDEGIRSKMFSDLIYIVPLLIFLYIVQAYTSFRLFYNWYYGICTEYQVPILASLFIFLCLGNCRTLIQILKAKASLAKGKPKMS